MYDIKSPAAVFGYILPISQTPKLVQRKKKIFAPNPVAVRGRVANIFFVIGDR